MKNKIEWKTLSPEVILLITENIFLYPEIINLKYVLFAKVAEEKKNLIIDCSKLDYIDDTAIRVIIGLNEILVKMGFSLSFFSSNSIVKQTISKSELGKVTKIYASLDNALKEMSPTAENTAMNPS